MNRGRHLLVFSRRLGAFVAVAETAPRRGTASSARPRGGLAVVAALLAGAWIGTGDADAQTRAPVQFASQRPAPAQPLPQPYGTLRTPGGAFVNDPALRSFVANPAHRDQVRWEVAADGRSATLHQGSVDRVILNWDRFDIAAGHRVHFEQNPDPTRYVSALNRIWSADPSLILGSLTATREVILVNANGVYFGRGARVDTGKFVATALNFADSTFERGLRNVTDGSAVFAADAAGYTATSPDAAVSVEAGAEIRSAAGGDVLLIAPRVVNAGRIDTPAGQQVLAAGQRVYLMSSSDPAQRGLIVAVDPFLLDTGAPDPTLGLAENRADGRAQLADGVASRIDEMRADRGSINLVGLTVRQAGVVNATTAVKGANGVVTLQAMASTVALSGGPEPTTATSRRGLVVESGATARAAAGGGTVELAAGSTTRVMPAEGAATQLAAEVFNESRIRVEGERIAVGEGAQVQAPAGRIELLAATSRAGTPLFDNTALTAPAAADQSRIVIAPGAGLSVGGLRGVAVDGARNQGSQRLFRIELADAPVQRDGPLYREQVFFDLRAATGVGVANVAGAAAGIGYTAQELSTRGGQLRIESEGAVVVGERARLDASGGSVRVSTATLSESQLVRDGALVLFSDADAGTRYDALSTPRRTLVPAYDEGRDGGSLVLGGRRLALAGELQGSVVQGERQAAGLDAAARPARLAVGRAAGGSGVSLPYLAGIALVGSQPELGVAPWAAPLTAPLEGLPDVTALALDALQAAGFGALVLRAGELRQPDFGTLNLGLAGSLDALAKRITLDGAFVAPGGSIVLRTDEATPASATSGLGRIELSSRSRLDTAGLWTNDTVSGGATAPSPLQLDGGSISVRAAHDLRLAPGATLDVSGGARLSSRSRLSFGKAGSLTLASGRSEQFTTQLSLAGVWLRGVDAGSGGRLNLSSPDLLVAEAAAGASADAGDFSFALDPAFFSAGGFGRISVDAAGEVRIAAGTRLEPVLSSWQPAAGAARVPSGAMSSAVAVAAPLDEALADRPPVNLSLAARRAANPQLGIEASDLVVERGARIRLEDGGALTLTATGSLSVGALGGRAGQPADISVPGGTLRLAIEGVRGDSSPLAALDPVGFTADQALWLGAEARLSVAGAAELRLDGRAPLARTFGPLADAAAPRLTGDVRGGGRIELAAERGYVVAAAGSQLRLDGAAAALSLPGAAQPVTVARAAGRLVVSSPEGVVLDGTVSAQPPRDGAGQALADGGALELSIGLGGVYGFTLGTAYPAGPRVALVGEHGDVLATRGVAFGSDLAAGLGNGTAFVPLGLLANAGFDQWRLGAGDRIRFDSPAQLSAPIAITLDAPVLDAAAGQRVSLSADRVALGDRTGSRRAPAADARASAADLPTVLSVQARSIDVAGRLALQGFSDVRLDAGARADGELLLSAVNPQLPSDPTQLEGRLAFDGALTLTASRVFATTASLFTVDGGEGSQLSLQVGAGGAATVAPLSVFGELVMRADRIDHRGVLWQPFGAITLEAATELLLGDGSVTRVSGSGQSLLYGRSANLSVWQLPSQGRVGTDEPQTLPLAKGVNLRAPAVQAAPGAVVDVSGGGDVLAWEFFPGVGGSVDAFDSAGLYAVLPDHGRRSAVSLTGGIAGVDGPSRELVVTMAGSGLAPGTYTLLPARYALLGGQLPQGAFLVRPVAGGGALAGAPQVLDDGAVVVAANARDAGSAWLGSPAERWQIESIEAFERRSEIRLTSVGSLLAGYAAAVDAPPPPRPVDGGALQVQITGTAASAWSAAIQAGAGGGRAGTLDIAATRLALVDDLVRTPAGHVGIASATLAGSGAGSVLLGGLRTAAVAGDDGLPSVRVDATGTASVRVDLGGGVLPLEELILASAGTLDLRSGTVSTTTAATLGDRRLSLVGDGALAVVSANGIALDRGAAPLSAGVLDVASGVSLRGATVALDATASLRLAPSVDLQATNLLLGAPWLTLGATDAAAPSATVIDGGLLSRLQASDGLTLRAYAGIDFIGDQRWAARDGEGHATRVLDSLTLDAPVVASRGGSTDIAARQLVLRNSLGTAGGAPGADGSLQLQALPPVAFGRTGGLTVGPGAVQLAATTVALRSTGDIVLQGQGGLSASGDLQLSAARLTATNAAVHTIDAAGRLRMASEAGARTEGERVGLGAEVTLSAREIEQAGVIELPSGALALRAAGAADTGAALTLAAGSRTTVAGTALDNGRGFVADSPAGTVQLQAGRGALVIDGVVDASTSTRADGSRGDGDGGRIGLSAVGAGGTLMLGPAAELRAAGGTRDSDRGGRADLDLRRLADTTGVLAALAAGGVDGELALRVREGAVQLSQDLRAERIDIAADAGALSLRGAHLDARAADGGLVRLAASDGVTVGEGSRIDVQAGRAGARGGEIQLDAGTGRLQVDASSRLQAGDGRVTLRARRTDDGRGLDAAPLDGASFGAGEIVLEAVRVYEGIGTVRAGASAAGVLGLSTLSADNNAFMAGASGATGLLGVAGDGRFSLRAGVEVRSNGNLGLTSAWNLAAERPGGAAGALTLRAAGTLTIGASLSDGFVSAAANAAPGALADAWSMRLVAGADTGAAQVMATRPQAAADLVLAPGVRVRTGAASIELAAARDVLFGGSGASAAAVLVAGSPLPEATGVLDTLFARQPARPRLTGAGLRLEVTAGRDIVAAESAQVANNWLWRSGLIQPTGAEAGLYAASSHLAWWAEFGAFSQSLGAFGGAGLRAEAGRDIVNLQAMLPDTAWADSRDPAQARLQQRGGGDLSVIAGRDIQGGQFLVAAGEGRLTAGRSITAAAANATLDDVLLAQMSGGRFTLQARQDLAVGGSYNPTLAPTTTARNPLSRTFASYGDGAALELRAAAGRLELGSPEPEGSFGLADSAALQAALRVLPASLQAFATGGDLQVLGTQSALMFPEAGADLRLWAAQDLQLGRGPNAVLAMSDAAPGSWPDFRSPSAAGPVLTTSNSVLSNGLADSLPRSGLHGPGEAPVALHAGASLRAEGLSSWLLPKPAQVSAGLDIIGLRLLGQNLAADQRTELVAGRNLLAGLQGLIELGGPGTLDVRAGRDIDLGASGGIVTIGNRKGAALPSRGADVRLAAATAGVLDLAVLEAWRRDDPLVAEALVAQVRAALRQPTLDADAAWAAFQALPSSARTAIGHELLAAQFRRTYLEGPAPTSESVTGELRAAFERRKAELLAAGDAALAERRRLALPGGDLQELPLPEFLAALRGYVDDVRALRFEDIDIEATVAARVRSLQSVRDGWQAELAAGRGSAADFDRYREKVLQLETVATGSSASAFGRLALPMRLALFDQGFRAAELAGAGSFVAQDVWPGAPLLQHQGRLEMTQSAVVTERGGDIALLNPGGAINVGLKDAAGGGPKGVIALGGGDIFGYARDDFQVNVQRVFVVGQGDLRIWSSFGDIDSGRGANTAVAAPPLAPRRAADGVVFEIPATTTGSGLGIVADVNGRADGTIGLYPAFGEIRALDAFIRAPRIELAASVRGADNLGGAVTGSGSVVVAAPAATNVSSPPPASEERQATAGTAGTGASATRQSLLTVELLGLGPGEPCEGLSGPPLDECRRKLATEPPRPRP